MPPHLYDISLYVAGEREAQVCKSALCFLMKDSNIYEDLKAKVTITKQTNSFIFPQKLLDFQWTV